MVGRYLRDEAIVDAVVWVYHPGFGPIVARLPHRLIVYDCVDEYSQFPEYRANPEWLPTASASSAGGGRGFHVRQHFFSKARKSTIESARARFERRRRRAFQACLGSGPAVPADIGRLPRPMIGFVGAVSDYKLNIDWVVQLARRRPDFSVVLIGAEGVADPSTDVA